MRLFHIFKNWISEWQTKNCAPAQRSRSVKKSGKEFFSEETLLELKFETGQREGELSSTYQSGHLQRLKRLTGQLGPVLSEAGPARQAQQGPGSAGHLRQFHLGTRDENQEAWALT